ncbi:GNAT family N-acetyltransferase [bacterium SCSIO 12741]|nr:GNAT family N-acetyltransferase [bacterium SCSIO 12741]
MTTTDLNLRTIQPADDPQVKQLVINTLKEFGAVGPGYASSDTELDSMYEAYTGDDRVYFILEREGQVVGGAGIGPLKKSTGSTCELQKMYFDPSIRGEGWGKKLIQKCLDFAKESGYSQCYLETLPGMKPAQHLYSSFGFSYISERKGDTGHSGCHVFMMKTL